MPASQQQKYLSKIEERGITDALIATIRSKLRGENGSNYSHLSTASPLNKWMRHAIEDGRLTGVEELDVSVSLLAACGAIDPDSKFVKIVRQHIRSQVQFYKNIGTMVDSECLARTMEYISSGSGSYVELSDTSSAGDEMSIVEERSSSGKKILCGGEWRGA